MTPLLDAAVAVVVVLPLNLWIVYWLRRSFPREEVPFLTRTYWATMALRASGAVILNLFASDSYFAATFWGDSATYDYAGYALAQYWAGEPVYLPRGVTGVSGFGFYYFVAAAYFMFGRNQLLVQLLNGTIGSVSVLIIYAIGRRLFDAPVARRAALLMAFLPQMVFWSCALFKDPAILLCIALCMFAVIRLAEDFKIRFVLLFIAAALGLMTLRFYVFYMVLFATFGTFAFMQRRRGAARLISYVVLAGAFLGALGLAVRTETLEQQSTYLDLERLQLARQGQSELGASGYGAEIDVSKPGGILAAIPVGLANLLLAPYPWAISGTRQLLALPEILVWYAMMPALIRGLTYTLKHRFRANLPILLFTAILTLAYAVFQTNVGTVYRQRTQLTIFFSIFIGVGLELRKSRRLRDQTP